MFGNVTKSVICINRLQFQAWNGNHSDCREPVNSSSRHHNQIERGAADENTARDRREAVKRAFKAGTERSHRRLGRSFYRNEMADQAELYTSNAVIKPPVCVQNKPSVAGKMKLEGRGRGGRGRGRRLSTRQ